MALHGPVSSSLVQKKELGSILGLYLGTGSSYGMRLRGLSCLFYMYMDIQQKKNGFLCVIPPPSCIMFCAIFRGYTQFSNYKFFYQFSLQIFIESAIDFLQGWSVMDRKREWNTHQSFFHFQHSFEQTTTEILVCLWIKVILITRQIYLDSGIWGGPRGAGRCILSLILFRFVNAC